MPTALAELAAFTKKALAHALGKPQAYDEIRKVLQAGLGQTTNPPLAGCSFTIGAEAANVINVVVQLVDGYGTDMAERSVVDYYLSSDTNGDTLAADPGTTAIGTDGTILVEYTDDLVGKAISEADGDIDFNVTHTGTSTFYLNIVLPNGKKKTSAAITFA